MALGKNIALEQRLGRRSVGRSPGAKGPLGLAVEVAGFDELQAKLLTLPAAMQKAIGRKATRAAAKIVQRAAIALAPVDTGALRKNIKVRAKKRSRRGFGHEVVVTRESLGLAYQHTGINPKHQKGEWPAFYPAVLEYGTKGGKPVLDKDGKPTGRVTKPRAPRPFMRPALHANLGRVQDVIARTVAAELGKVMQGTAAAMETFQAAQQNETGDMYS